MAAMGRPYNGGHLEVRGSVDMEAEDEQRKAGRGS